MSTLTQPSASSSGSMVDVTVCTLMRALSVNPLSATKRTKQREPLPHCSTSLPSLL